MNRFAKQEAESSAAQEARTARGLIEGPDYQFLPARPGVWYCTSVSGSQYIVSEHSCTCPDHQYRCAPSPEARCKHQVALGHKLIADGVDLVHEGLKLARAQRAEEEAAFDRIFD